MAGGLYRGVSLVSTPKLVSFSLNDLGSTGVFATTQDVSNIQSSGVNAFGTAKLN